MARRKVVEEKNYDELIKVSEEKITALTNELKEEKENLKKLKKDKVCYDTIMEEKKKQEKTQKIAELISESGKTLEEIEKLLLG